MYSKKEIVEQNKEFIIEQYNNPHITQTQIAQELGVNHSTLNRYAKSLGLTKAVKVKMTAEKLSWLKKNYNLPYKELIKHTGCCAEVIRQSLIKLGVKRTTKYRPFKLDMGDKEFLGDLENPTLCAPDIVEKYKEKYGIGESRVHQLRKQRKIKLQIDTLKRPSLLELRVRGVLEKLDVAFIPEKLVGKYHIDFYLGFKICLEVQSTYWHNKPNRVETDKRKKAYLEKMGYKVIYVWEDEISDAENYLRTTLQKLGLPIQ